MSELELHPGAAAEIDRRGNVLLGRLVSRTDDEIREERDFDPDRYISGTISNGEIAEIRSATVDGAGEEVAKYFTEGVSQVGLEDDAYEAFADLAGMIFRTAAFNPYVSRDRIKDVVFDWFRDARRLATRQTLARYLVEACAGEIADYQIAIPIARLSVESPVVVGRATIRPLSGALLDEWLGGTLGRLCRCEGGAIARTGDCASGSGGGDGASSILLRCQSFGEVSLLLRTAWHGSGPCGRVDRPAGRNGAVLERGHDGATSFGGVDVV